MKRLLSFLGVLMIAITSAFAQTYQAVPGSLDHKLFRYSVSEMNYNDEIGNFYEGRYFYVDLAIPADGDYTLTFKTSTPYVDGKATIATNSGSVASVDGENTTEISFATTGGWTAYTQSHTVLLKDVKKGNVTLTFTSTDKGSGKLSPGNLAEFAVQNYIEGTGVTFTSNEAKGYQSKTENASRSLSGLTFDATTSDWVTDGTVVNNGAVGTAGLKQCIQRRNKGWWSGDLCDWLTLTYEAPSYTKIDYTLTVDVSVAKTGEKNSVRASYYDFGTDANGNWASRTKLSDGTTTYRTTSGIYTDRKAPVNGELAAVWMYTSTYGKTDYDENSVTLNVTVDNSEGTEAKSENRYGLFVSSKSVTANEENILNYSQLRLKYTATATYCNVITFDANEGKGTMANQTIEGAGTLTANTLTREGYTFAGWNTSADGKGTAYTDEQAITVTSETKGAITLYAQWDEATAAADYTWLFTNTTLENNQLADGGVVLENVSYLENWNGEVWIHSTASPLTITADGKKIVRIVVTCHEFNSDDPAQWIVNQTEGFTWTLKEQYVAEWTGEATSVVAGMTDCYLIDKIEVWVKKKSTAIDNIDAHKTSSVIKTIENGQVVIIKEGVRYDITGRKL